MVPEVAITPEAAALEITEATPLAVRDINDFSQRVLNTRGGRVGSGMGVLIEALWVYYVNQQLLGGPNGPRGIELAWLPDHEYNDYACVLRGREWDPGTRVGELLRIEAKSMNIDADESKAHFDEIATNLEEWDQLVVPVWRWSPVDENRVYPLIEDCFIGRARPIAMLRDGLHIARGGTFVNRDDCPDGCIPEGCGHHGEPLNANGRRERASGPESRRPSQQVSFASNFGGLLRMLYTRTNDAKQNFGRIRAEDDEADAFISFVHRNYPDMEFSQYMTEEWRRVARECNVDAGGLSKLDLVDRVRREVDGLSGTTEIC